MYEITDQLEFEHVSFVTVDTIEDESAYLIHFLLKDNLMEYYFNIRKGEKKWVNQRGVYHYLFNSKENCPLCHKRTIVCDFLTGHADDIFEKLSTHPSIRLELIF
jgi:hypothetical protein